jgi:hypothetical protein
MSNGKPASEPDELARRAPEFPDHMIWREQTPYGIRYIARGLALSVQPHTLVTKDLTEIWAELSAARHQGDDGQRMVITTESETACQE